MPTIETATTKEEYLEALALEKAEQRHEELETLRTRAYNPQARRYAERQLYIEFGEGDLAGKFSS